MIPRVLAVDLSLTRTGLCDDDGPTTYAASGEGLTRLAAIRDRVLDAAAAAELVAIEGYSFGSKGRAVVSIGELGGVVRLALAEAGVAFVDVPPSTLKKYATGKGNAGKDEVLEVSR